jgi:TRAP-type C4-dicarboxylate transport system permease small subunit
MDRWLDRLFVGSGMLAAVFLAGICVLVVAQVVGRLFGVLVPSADEFAGYCLAASSFLALGYALRSNSHIRVTLVLTRLPGARRVLEIVCAFGGLAISGYLTYYTLEMIWFSFSFGDVTQGLVPIPLWIPQSGMAVGVMVLTLAFLVDAVSLLRGREPTYVVAERREAQSLERDSVQAGD